ncbi:hypothetical protein OMB55_00011120 [gamma proteobacterium HIMB55]|nr:hypothetical protein OMB55_00011120 [gamma proteobacterium HIMB55]
MDLVAFEAGAKKNCPIYEFLGLSVLEAENGVFKATIPNSKEAGNHIGIMHAGVLFSLGEFLGGLITARYLDNPRKFQPVVRDLKIDFKAPAMTDITATAYFSAEQGLEMNAKLEETGRYDFQQKAVLTDTNGTVVAETLGSYALRNFMG